MDLPSNEMIRNRYLAEHFTFIRDKILKHVYYPVSARRLGWQGKVVISFIISSNGSITEARVAQGSGHNILDQSALAALKESAPFPRPPLEAQIVLPVVYRLE